MICTKEKRVDFVLEQIVAFTDSALLAICCCLRFKCKLRERGNHHYLVSLNISSFLCGWL